MLANGILTHTSGTVLPRPVFFLLNYSQSFELFMILINLPPFDVVYSLFLSHFLLYNHRTNTSSSHFQDTHNRCSCRRYGSKHRSSALFYSPYHYGLFNILLLKTMLAILPQSGQIFQLVAKIAWQIPHSNSNFGFSFI